MHRSPTRRAFTLVELIVVVVILGILAGIGLVSYQQVTKRAQDKSIESTVTTLAKEAQALAAYRADGVFTADDLDHATADLPALPAGVPGAAAWDVKTAPYGFVTAYGQLHVRLAPDGSAAGIAAMSLSGNCLLTRATPTGAPTFRFVGSVGGSCSGDTALAAKPTDKIDWTDPTTAGPPARPTGLASQLTAGGVVLTWTANTESDLAGYRITVDGIAQPELLSVPTATIPAVPGEHTVTVVAVDKSALSSDASAPLLAAVPPAGPAQVTAAVAHGAVTVSWTAAPGATSYRIWHQLGTDPATVLGQVLAPATSLTDGNLPAGVSVTYSVAAANRGGESAATVAGTAITAPTAAPTAVTAAASGTDITVGWTAPAGATGFRVYRDGAAIPAWAGTAGTFTDTGLPVGSTHSYVVTASNAGGESAPSAPASATTVPTTPVGLVATAGDGSIDLAWQATPAAAGYRVYRSTDGATFTLLGQATDATFTDSSLTNGTHYWYAVAAYNGAGESGQSTAASSTPLPPIPAVPTGVTTAVSGTAATISWAPADRADGYRIYKNGTLLAQVTAGTSATDTLTAGTSATYTVAAYNLAGESAQSASASATAETSAPTGVKATAAGTTITVTWTAPAGATSFAVYRDSATTPAWTGTGTSWADTSLPVGTTHSYAVTAVNAAGESVKSYPALATVVPGTPPGLTATAGDNTVALSWAATPGAQGFRIYRSTDGTTFTLLGQSSAGRSYTDATAVNGTTYSYAVSAYNGAGESGQSAPAAAKPLPPVPAVPTGVTTSVTGTTATISWTQVSRADGYRIYKNGSYLAQVTGTTSATDTLTAGETATYTVSAYNIAGESGQSGTSTASAQPTTPTGVTASASGTTITVAWTAPAGATGFKVYRDGATTPAWTGTGTSWADAGLATGSTHSYVVTATNAAGESPTSAAVSATTAPATPTGLEATAGDGTAALSWNATPAATGYRLYRSTDGATFTQLAQLTGTSFTDATVANGTSYWYAVSAINGAGESGQSTAASTKPLPPLPATPTGVTATLSGSTVTVSWTAVDRADDYNIYAGGSLLKSVSAPATSTTVTIAAGATVSYTVAAHNLAGTSAQSTGASVTAPPAAPTGVTATANNTTVTVGWALMSGATSYDVHRGSAVVATGLTGTSWTDSGLAEGTSYNYFVCAINAGGFSCGTTVSATTIPPTPSAPSASRSGTTATISWPATAGAASYTVSRSSTNMSSGAVTTTTLKTGLTGTSTTDTIAAGERVTYGVQAANPAGTSAWSAASGSVETTVIADSAPAAKTNLVANGGFESGTTGWTALNSYLVWSAPTSLAAGSHPYEGTHVASLTKNNTAQSSLYEDFSVNTVVGGVYCFSGMVTTPGTATGGSGSFSLWSWNAGGTTASMHAWSDFSGLPGSGQWIRGSACGTETVAHSTLRVEIYAPNPGTTIYLDDVRVWRQS